MAQPTIVRAERINDDDYVEIHTMQEPLVVQEGWSSSNRYTNRQNAYRSIAGYACVVCCILFFLLFFLIPRSPAFSSDFNTAIVSNNPFIISQTYSVYNPNPYSLTVESIQTRLVTQATVQVSNPTPEMISYAVVGLGTFPPGTSSVKVPASGWQDLMVYYNFNTTANSGKAVAANLYQCCHSFSTFVTSGSFDMSTSIHDYNGVSFGTLIEEATCTGPRCQ